jgi:TPR repeat protein
MAKQAGASGQKGEAISYLKKSAEMGYPVAEGALGTGYINGQEVPRDGKLGVYWLENAAAHGSRGAQVELGIVYEDGLGVPVNHMKGFTYLKEAAEQHQSLAEHRVGLDYEIGQGVTHNRALAIAWLRRAAADGAPVAGDTANALAQAKVAQFRSVEAIDDYMNPPPPAQKASGCPGFPHYISGPLAMGVQYLYCTCHPGCPTTWDTEGPRCPPGPPHCTN